MTVPVTLQDEKLQSDSSTTKPLGTMGSSFEGTAGHNNAAAGGDSVGNVLIRGMPIHFITLAETVKHVLDACRAGKGGWVVTPNLDILRRFKRSATFRNLVASSSLNVADGMPLVWASRIAGQPIPGRVNGTDLMVELCKAVSEFDHSVYFLGGNQGTADKTADAMKQQFPGLRVAGCLCPEFGFESNIDAVKEIENQIVAAKPKIVFVGLGSPKQDVLINMLRLKFPDIWWLGVGVSFSFIAGDLARAPEWAKNNGCEWVYRLMVEPKRLFKRYLVDGIPFFATTIVACAYQRFFPKHQQDEHAAVDSSASGCSNLAENSS